MKCQMTQACADPWGDKGGHKCDPPPYITMALCVYSMAAVRDLCLLKRLSLLEETQVDCSCAKSVLMLPDLKELETSHPEQKVFRVKDRSGVDHVT